MLTGPERDAAWVVRLGAMERDLRRRIRGHQPLPPGAWTRMYARMYAESLGHHMAPYRETSPADTGSAALAACTNDPCRAMLYIDPDERAFCGAAAAWYCPCDQAPPAIRLERETPLS